ncbi:Protein of unknown function [Gryllus bimaculatus]|nr:Protein of unknown function [Gryllus bimaculatus]
MPEHSCEIALRHKVLEEVSYRPWLFDRTPTRRRKPKPETEDAVRGIRQDRKKLGRQKRSSHNKYIVTPQLPTENPERLPDSDFVPNAGRRSTECCF